MTFAFDPQSVSLPRGHFIGGRHVPGDDAIHVTAPSDGRALGAIPRGDAGVVERAVQAARAALEQKATR